MTKKRRLRPLSPTLTLVPENEWPKIVFDPKRIEVWVSNKFVVQVFEEAASVLRLSISRVDVGQDGRWMDGISWDELQWIKRAVGRGDRYAVEVYPMDIDVVNDANMRHLWVLPTPLPIGWFRRSV